MIRHQKNSKLFLIIFLFTTSYSFAQTPCENGMAGIYPCDNVDMVSNVTVTELLAENTGGVWINDIWGWTDPSSGIEYALVAMTNGTSFVDISDPLNPIVLGMLPEHASATSGRSSQAQANSIWRDVKVFNNHAFIVSEDPGHGMQVFDLTSLRNVSNPPIIFPETAHYDGVSDSHNIFINEETGYAYILGATGGSTCNKGGLHIVDVNDPINPTYVGCFDDDGYTHDAQCIVYDGPDADYIGREICFNSNENTITIADVTDKDNPSMVSSSVYPQVRYAHQGWLSDDRKYFYSNDELDESNNGTNTRTFVWNVENLDNPVLVSIFTHEGISIDHNLYVKDTLIYESNYSSGLRILNNKHVATIGLMEVGHFDTYPQDNRTSFSGSWSNYPFFESGNIIVTDQTNGLFILRYNPKPIENPDVVAPTVPNNLVSSDVGISTLTIEWTASTDDIEVAGYVVYLNSLDNNPIGTTTNTSYLLENLTAGTDYTILIQAFDASGNTSSPISINLTTGVDNMAPSVPSDLSVRNITTTSFIVDWSNSEDNVNVAGYNLYLNEVTNETKVTTVETAYQFNELTNDRQYKVFVEAFDEVGNVSEQNSIDVALVLSISDLYDSRSVNLYPNPASNYFKLDFSELPFNSAVLELYDFSGKRIAAQDFDLTSNKEVSFNTTSLKKGLYHVRITDGKDRITKRLLIK